MSRENYLSAESEQGRILVRWQAQQEPGPLRNEIGLMKYLMSQATELQQFHLVADYAGKIAQLEKTAQVMAVQAREWVKPTDVQRFADVFGNAICAEFNQDPCSRDKMSAFYTRLCEALGLELDRNVYDAAVESYFGPMLDWQERVWALSDKIREAVSYNGEALTQQPALEQAGGQYRPPTSQGEGDSEDGEGL